jgi:hypothetical protein
MNDQAKPPLGLKPRWVVDMHRTVEILAAMQRYVPDGLPIPVEWADELNDLLYRQRERASELDAQP